MEKELDPADYRRFHEILLRSGIKRRTEQRMRQYGSLDLCGACQKSFSDQPGEPEIYLGEKFCAPCVKLFLHGESPTNQI